MPRYFELDVALQEIQPRIRRRFSIRTTSTFAQLHNAIHQGYGWWDSHLWEFRLPTVNGKPIAGLPTDDDFGRPTPDAREVKLSSYFTGKNVTEWCEYLYDFDAEETAEMLLGWMDNDNYGFCYQLEREAVKALTKKGLSVFASRMRVRFDAAGRAKAREDSRENSYRRRYSGRALKTIYTAQRDVDAYVSLCEETELVPLDCEILAGILQSRRKPEQALAWVERGLELRKKIPVGRGASYQLVDMKRKLLIKLGQSSEALASAWSEFEKSPSRPAYDQLMKYVPKGERAAWHDKAIAASAQADLRSVTELWLATKETERLVERLRAASHEELESLSHYTTEPAAKKLVRSHPDVAAKVYRALGMRILNAKKSRYYDAALSNFEQVKRCYRKAELDPAWDELVDEVRRNHSRKSSFMPGFERLVQGQKPQAKPSLRDRTERRKGSWARRGGSGNDGD